MVLVSANDDSLFWLDKYFKVYIYGSSLLALLRIDRAVGSILQSVQP